MSSNFVHGIEVVEQDSGRRPIRTISTGVIGLVGTAKQGPVNTPTLVAGSRLEAARLFGPDGGTIPAALAGILDQIGAPVVVVNTLTRTQVTAAPETFIGDALQLGDGTGRLDVQDLVITNRNADTTYALGTDYEVDTATGVVTRVADGSGSIDANGEVAVTYSYRGGGAADDVIGGADASDYTGVSALLQARARGLPTPRILIAPVWSRTEAVTSALIAAADRLRAIVVADGPDTADDAAVNFRQAFDSRRLYIVDPGVRVGDPAVVEPASARVAGVIARSDAERGFWWSPSNRTVAGVVGTTRPVDFALGDAASRANHLNENAIATIINEDGYRLWGNRAATSDAKWRFLSVGRIADAINDRVLKSHLWAVDRNLTKTYLSDVVEGVNAFMREMVGLGAILGGHCWADPDLNTPDGIAAGKAVFSFDFTPVTPAERITFRSVVTNDYLEDLV